MMDIIAALGLGVAWHLDFLPVGISKLEVFQTEWHWHLCIRVEGVVQILQIRRNSPPEAKTLI